MIIDLLKKFPRWNVTFNDPFAASVRTPVAKDSLTEKLSRSGVVLATTDKVRSCPAVD